VIVRPLYILRLFEIAAHKHDMKNPEKMKINYLYSIAPSLHLFNPKRLSNKMLQLVW
jgi:hypothetical protein